MLIISRGSYFLLPLSLPVCYANEGPRFPTVSSKTTLTCSGQVYAANTATPHQSSIAFRRWNVSRARERSAFWLEPLKPLLIRYSLLLFADYICHFPKCYHNSKEKKTCKFLRICFDLSFLFSCSPLHFFFHRSFVAYSFVFPS